ncbi:MAG: hypothetical protein ACKVJN_10265, partial [Woeseiales bacterium]
LRRIDGRIGYGVRIVIDVRRRQININDGSEVDSEKVCGNAGQIHWQDLHFSVKGSRSGGV